ncbi:MAG: site-2 protease family protein, partial [Dehalococcoidia bacterium]
MGPPHSGGADPDGGSLMDVFSGGQSFFFAAGLFIVLLVPLVVIHEFGHFVAAKLFGIRVLEFGIGFPPKVR